MEHYLAEALDCRISDRRAKQEFDLASHDGMIAASDMVLGHLARVGNELARVETARIGWPWVTGWDERGFKKGLKRLPGSGCGNFPRTALEERNTHRIRPAEAGLLRFSADAPENPEAAARLLEELPEAVRLGPCTFFGRAGLPLTRAGKTRTMGGWPKMVP